MKTLKALFSSGVPGEVLCIGAHPDDIEIGCGGALLRLSEGNPGWTLHWVVLSGRKDRAKEGRTSAEEFSLSFCKGEMVIHGFRDGFFPTEWAAIKESLTELRQRVSPDIIFTHAGLDRHQDHRVVSEITWNLWRDETILEYEIPKWDGDLGSPNGFVPLSRSQALKKAKHVLEHFPSQGVKPWFSEDTLLGLMRLRGNECRAEEGYAEGFYVRKMALF